MTVKTRTIPGYLGKGITDAKYWTASSLTYDQYQPSWSNEEAWLATYLNGMLQRTTSVGVPQNGTESITSENGRGRENPCYHVKKNGVSRPFLAYTGAWDYSSVRYLVRYYRSPTVSGSIDVVQPVTDFRAAKSRAYYNMRPRFEGDVSMLNFLYELKDFRDIAKALPKAYKGLRSAWSDAVDHCVRNKQLWSGAVKDGLSADRVKSTKYYNDVLRRNSRYYDRVTSAVSSTSPTLLAAEAWLLNAFAIQPLLKDISSMLSQATLAAHDAQQAFKDASDSKQSSHYSEHIVHEDSGVTNTKNNYWKRSGVFRKTTYTATCKYTYDYTMRPRKDAFMRYWGLSGSLETLWNATPWSFLVDYVYTVGKSIHAMERDPNVNWHVKSWLDTTKYKHAYGVYVNGDSRAKVFVIDGEYFTPSRAHGMLLTGVEGSIYSRKVSQPMVGIAAPRLRGPSVGQWLNVAALARCFF